MRPLFIAALLLIVPQGWAAEPKPEAFAPVFELAGVNLLCEQSAPMIQHEMTDEQQADVARVMDAESMCKDLAVRLSKKISNVQLSSAKRFLESNLAKEFSSAERDVGEQLDELDAYRAKLSEQQPRASRVELIKRLDKAARTTELAALLRYEAGKTRVFLTMKARGAHVDEQTLAERTQAQAVELRESSAESVETFMLFAYRHKPTALLTEYAELYEKPAVAVLLKGVAETLPEIFAEKRAQL